MILRLMIAAMLSLAHAGSAVDCGNVLTTASRSDGGTEEVFERRTVYTGPHGLIRIETSPVYRKGWTHLVHLRILDGVTGQALHAREEPRVYFDNPRALRFSPDGRYVAHNFGGNDPVQIFSIETHDYVQIPSVGDEYRPKRERSLRKLGLAADAFFLDHERMIAGPGLSHGKLNLVHLPTAQIRDLTQPPRPPVSFARNLRAWVRSTLALRTEPPTGPTPSSSYVINEADRTAFEIQSLTTRGYDMETRLIRVELWLWNLTRAIEFGDAPRSLTFYPMLNLREYGQPFLEGAVDSTEPPAIVSKAERVGYPGASPLARGGYAVLVPITGERSRIERNQFDATSRCVLLRLDPDTTQLRIEWESPVFTGASSALTLRQGEHGLEVRRKDEVIYQIRD